MAGRVVLFGATGYTGRLAAEQMVARGMEPLLAARDPARVAQLGDRLGGLEVAVADVERPETVAALVEEGDVLVSTVGPFARWGGPALDAAIRAGATYLDSTGEPSFIRRVFEVEGPRAAAAGCALVTAMGYDWVPGNLAGALALREAGTAATRVRIGYFLTGGGLGGMSGGTRASSVGQMLERGYAWRGGRLVNERMAARVGQFEVDGKVWQGISTGTSEAFSLPRVHEGLQDVEVYLGWFGKAARAMQAGSLALAGAARVPGARRLADATLGRAVKGSTGGPSPEERASGGSLVVAEAVDAAGEVLARARVDGINPYDFTGGILAWAAQRAAAGKAGGSGALGPVEAFGLDSLREGAAEAGLRSS